KDGKFIDVNNDGYLDWVVIMDTAYNSQTQYIFLNRGVDNNGNGLYELQLEDTTKALLPNFYKSITGNDKPLSVKIFTNDVAALPFNGNFNSVIVITYANTDPRVWACDATTKIWSEITAQAGLSGFKPISLFARSINPDLSADILGVTGSNSG